MSLVKTLAKVAIGVAVAKGVSQLAKSGRAGGSARSGGGSLGGSGDLMRELGGMIGGSAAGRGSRSQTAGGGGGLEGLGGLLGGGAGGGLAGGLGGLLESLAGGATQASTTRRAGAPSGLDALLGGGGLGGGLGGLLGALAGAATGGGRSGSGGAGGLGDLLNAALSGNSAAASPNQEQELAAGLMLKAMIQAVKADGQLDAEEKKKLMAALEGAEEQEVAFVNSELAAPLDVAGLAAQVPQGMEAQIYAISLAAINLDNQAEAQYLHSLAQALELSPETVNAVHDQAGAQRLYA